MLLKRSASKPGIGERDLRRLDARWHALNQPFTLNDHMGPTRGSSVFIEKGARPLVFSAPHAVHHYRHGTLKTNDANTGGLAIALAHHLGGSAVALRRGGPEFGDPNAEADHPLKQEAAPLVSAGVIVADLHGMADREHDVIIGLGAAPTARSRELAERFVFTGERHGVAAIVADEQTGFNARGPATMTSWALTRGAIALQFEIARRLRSVKAPADRRAALLRTFIDVFA
ncbi:MAG: hypothetical protein WCC60_19540 [Ilumatobacteraceae bacterium]